MIDLSARFLKEDVRSPEAIYFAFPLNLPANWRAHFDTAGVPTELDAEQIPGSCRDWVTTETFASVHQPDFGVTLYCPDVPAIVFQVADRPSNSHQGAKELSAVMRFGAVLFAILVLNTPRK